ncbi:MAG TPA: DHA2 family efflux MFS transporter permease subunit [Jatrophihabitantaceae bacterium]|jgi:EmrB/QacA subfamily drug resistance transporter|nr:DHA2 family efflux MFS transporter permease subunit [Jatrophihabitantaceae bacterium]
MVTTPTPRRPPIWLAIVACSLPMFMTALDNLVVSTALRTLQVKLHASTEDLQWFVNAYTLGFACFLLTGAALGDRFGRRRLFNLGTIVFTLASIGCGLSTSSAGLIGFRAVQGLGAAAVMPLSLTLLSAAVPARKRSMAVGIWSAISGLAIALGPVVGGAVVDGLGWHWIFWLNVPVGIVAVPLAYLVLQESRGQRVKMDIVGMGLASLGLLSVVWAIVNGQTKGWTSSRIVTAFVVGVVLLFAFVIWERRVRHPLLPLGFYRIRAFALTNLVSMTMYFGVFGSIFLLAQYLQIAPPRSALHAGVLTLSWTLVPMFIAPLAGVLTDRVGGGRLMALGLGLQAVGLAWISLVAGADTPYSHLVAPMIIAGAGMGFAFPPAASVVLGAVGMQDQGKAAGANTTVRELGGAVGVAVLGTVFAARGSYASPQQFVDGLRPAVWVGVGVVAVGALIALAIPRGQDSAEPATVEARAELTVPA